MAGNLFFFPVDQGPLEIKIRLCDSTIAASKDTKKGYSPCALVSPGS